MELVQSKIVLLTAGLAPDNFVRAAKRISIEVRQLYKFSDIHVLGESNLAKYCPTTAKLYGEFLNPEIRGYGYWIWKPEFIYRVLAGEFGSVDQVVWVDSGCEVNANFVSKKVFARRVGATEDSGFWLHALQSTDYEYSKHDVISQFPEVSKLQLRSPQIQANYMHFSRNQGLPIVEEWFSRTTEKISNVNFETLNSENEEFVEHRSDQSILSLTAKSHGITFNRLNLPNGGSRKAMIRGIFEPIWISRNREGKSRIPRAIHWIP